MDDVLEEVYSPFLDYMAKTDEEKQVIFYASFRHQYFAYPDSIMYYIAKNPPNSKYYQKLVKTCKFFFVKNPIIVGADFITDGIGSYSWWMFDEDSSFPIEEISATIWITDKLELDPMHDEIESDFLSSIIPNIYQCDVTDLHICSQHISIKDFEFLASKCETMKLFDIVIDDHDGTVLSLEKIVAAFPKVKSFSHGCYNVAANSYSSQTVKELLKIPHFTTLTEFHLYGIPAIFDIDAFLTYIKKNKETDILLDFGEVSDVFRERLMAIIDEIIDSKPIEYKSPKIQFDGIEEFYN